MIYFLVESPFFDLLFLCSIKIIFYTRQSYHLSTCFQQVGHKNYDCRSFVYLEDAFLESEDIVKLLGILIDKELTFEDHIKWLLKKANQKLLALMRVSKYMTQEKLRILLKSFIESQFNYCPLIWMCRIKELHVRINNFHKKTY